MQIRYNNIAIMKFAFVLVSTVCFAFGPCLGQNLQAHPFITSASTVFGPFIEGASVNRAGHMFATNYGNANTVNQLGNKETHVDRMGL